MSKYIHDDYNYISYNWIYKDLYYYTYLFFIKESSLLTERSVWWMIKDASWKESNVFFNFRKLFFGKLFLGKLFFGKLFFGKLFFWKLFNYFLGNYFSWKRTRYIKLRMLVPQKKCQLPPTIGSKIRISIHASAF